MKHQKENHEKPYIEMIHPQAWHHSLYNKLEMKTWPGNEGHETSKGKSWKTIHRNDTFTGTDKVTHHVHTKYSLNKSWVFSLSG